MWHRQNDHRRVRLDTIDWLRQHEVYDGNDGIVRFSDFLIEQEYPNWNIFCQHMSLDGVYGNHFTLVAAAEVYKREIHVISAHDGSIQVITPKIRTSQKVHLMHYIEYHYNYCIPIYEDENRD